MHSQFLFALIFHLTNFWKFWHSTGGMTIVPLAVSANLAWIISCHISIASLEFEICVMIGDEQEAKMVVLFVCVLWVCMWSKEIPYQQIIHNDTNLHKTGQILSILWARTAQRKVWNNILTLWTLTKLFSLVSMVEDYAYT